MYVNFHKGVEQKKEIVGLGAFCLKEAGQHYTEMWPKFDDILSSVFTIFKHGKYTLQKISNNKYFQTW